jgi:hypothetical protein
METISKFKNLDLLSKNFKFPRIQINLNKIWTNEIFFQMSSRKVKLFTQIVGAASLISAIDQSIFKGSKKI